MDDALWTRLDDAWRHLSSTLAGIGFPRPDRPLAEMLKPTDTDLVESWIDPLAELLRMPELRRRPELGHEIEAFRGLVMDLELARMEAVWRASG